MKYNYAGVKQSSLSKCERMERGEASKAMFWTSLRAGFVYHLALFTFEEGYLIYLWVRRVVESRVCRKGKGGEITLQSFAKKSVKNVLLCVVGVLAEAIGASIGTYVYPGYGTLALDRLFGTCAYLL